jgi:hypothetical protein
MGESEEDLARRTTLEWSYRLDVIEYLQEENRVLKERVGRRRIGFTCRAYEWNSLALGGHASTGITIRCSS